MVVRFPEGRIVTHWFYAKAWKKEWGDEYQEHRTAFPPRLVATVIEQVVAHGQLPEGLDLPGWEVLPPETRRDGRGRPICA
jgi:hypothetical protein